MWFPNPRDYDSAEDYYRDQALACKEAEERENLIYERMDRGKEEAKCRR